MGVGRFLEVVAHGGSTVYTFLLCAGSKWLVISLRAVEFQLFSAEECEHMSLFSSNLAIG